MSKMPRPSKLSLPRRGDGVGVSFSLPTCSTPKAYMHILYNLYILNYLYINLIFYIYIYYKYSITIPKTFVSPSLWALVVLFFFCLIFIPSISEPPLVIVKYIQLALSQLCPDLIPLGFSLPQRGDETPMIRPHLVLLSFLLGNEQSNCWKNGFDKCLDDYLWAKI